MLSDVQHLTSVNFNQNLLVAPTFVKRRKLICTPHSKNLNVLVSSCSIKTIPEELLLVINSNALILNSGVTKTNFFFNFITNNSVSQISQHS